MPLLQVAYSTHSSLPLQLSTTDLFLQPDYKIFEMNKRLQQRTDDSDNLWFAFLFVITIVGVIIIRVIIQMIRWDAFANEFFEDEAQLTLTFCLEDGPKRYSEHRNDEDDFDYYQ